MAEQQKNIMEFYWQHKNYSFPSSNSNDGAYLLQYYQDSEDTTIMLWEKYAEWWILMCKHDINVNRNSIKGIYTYGSNIYSS